MDEKQLALLKLIQLEMLKNFIEICDKLKLSYFALGGTALGAIRHEGFIPWDDDIDIGMPREDYERFIKNGQKYIKKNYFLQTYQSDKRYPLCFAKIRDSNTTFIEKTLKDININHGVYIDIFPLDGCSSNKCIEKYKKIMKTIYDIRISSIFYYEDISRKSLKLILLEIISKIICHKQSINDIVKRKDKLLSKCSYDKNNIVSNYYGAWGEKEIMFRSFFGDGNIKKFEGIDIIVPEKYDLYLTQLYGDYMEFPPENKRKGHHYYEVLDLEKSYKYYVF